MAIDVINLDTPILYCFNMRQYVLKMDMIDPSLPRTPAITDANPGPYSIAMKVESMYDPAGRPGRLSVPDRPEWYGKTGVPAITWDTSSGTLNMFGHRDQLNKVMSELHFHQNQDWDAEGEAALRIAVTIVNQWGVVQQHEIYLVPQFITFNPIDDHFRDTICMIRPRPLVDVAGKPPGHIDPPPDFYSDKVVSHLNMDGPDQWSLFFDSTYREWTAQGRAQTSITQTRFGSSAALFEMGGYLETEANDAFGMGFLDFTYEAWVYPRSFDTAMHIVGSYEDPINFAMSLQFRRLNFYDGSVWHRTTDIHFDINQWYFVAVTRKDGVIRMFVDGKLVDTFNSVGNMVCTKKVIVGGGPNFVYDGYIDELRITRSQCRYESDFDPPITEFSFPRGPLALGGAKFYGKGELLYPANLDYQFGFGDFSLEAWISPRDNAGHQVIMSSGRMFPYEPNSSWEFSATDQYGNIAFYAKSHSVDTPIVTAPPAPISVWTHVAVTRENGLTRLFVNGAIMSTSKISYDISGAEQVLRVGAGEGKWFFNGRMDAIRIGKGRAYYRSAFLTQHLIEVGAFDPWVVFLHNFNSKVIQWVDITGKVAERILNVTTGEGSYPYIQPQRGGFILDKNPKRKKHPYPKVCQDKLWNHKATVIVQGIQSITTVFQYGKRRPGIVEVAVNKVGRAAPYEKRSWRNLPLKLKNCRSLEANWLLPYIATYQCHNWFEWDGRNVNHHTFLQTCSQTPFGDRNFRSTALTPFRSAETPVSWTTQDWWRICAHPNGIGFDTVTYQWHNDIYYHFNHYYSTGGYELNSCKQTKTTLNRANKVIREFLWSHNVVFMTKKPCFVNGVKHILSSHLCFTSFKWNPGIQNGKTRVSTPRPATIEYNFATRHAPDISAIWRRGNDVKGGPSCRDGVEFQKAKMVKPCGFAGTKDGGRMPFGRVSGGVTRIANKRTGRTH